MINDVYVIGDLQGCHDSLQTLITLIEQESPDAQFVFVGDLVNRGPQSLATLRHICLMGKRAHAVLGNHDLHLLAVASGLRPMGRRDTLQDILAAPDREELIDWLRQLPLALTLHQHLFVHAGVLPQWDTPKTLALAEEVQTALRGPDWKKFLKEMYGNLPNRWDDRLTGNERLRCIVNALTRIRLCHVDGSMDFDTDESSLVTSSGSAPWYTLPERRTQDTPIVFGHWSTQGLVQKNNVTGLDTGCIWGGKLTAMRLSDRRLVQVDCPCYQQPG